jgi:hypothetical protein
MAATDTNATTEELLGEVFPVWSVPRNSCEYERVLRRQLEEQAVGVKWLPAWEDLSPGARERPLMKTQQTEEIYYVL